MGSSDRNGNYKNVAEKTEATFSKVELVPTVTDEVSALKADRCGGYTTVGQVLQPM